MEETERPARDEKLARLPALLLPWYDKNKRDLPWRENTDPYRVWVSEIMLQQTRVEAAKEHYIRFVRELPDVHALAACPEEKLFKLWEGLGYYSRARNLQRAAKIVAERGFPQDAAGWRALPGVGSYTAGAVCSICFGQPTPAVDGNVVRVLSRLLGDGRPQEELRADFGRELAPAYPQERRGDFTQSLMELGATVCLPSSPLCLACPLLPLCKTRSDALPAREKKAERRKTAVTLLLFSDGARLALCRRRAGVLRGMYGFFCIEAALTAEEVCAFLSAAGLCAFRIGAPSRYKHVFTHIEWEMEAYPVFLSAGGAEGAEGAKSAGGEGDGVKGKEGEPFDPAGALRVPEELLPAGCAHSGFAELKWFSRGYIESSLSLPTAFRRAMATDKADAKTPDEEEKG